MSSNVHGRERIKASSEVIGKRRDKEALKIKQYNELVEKCRYQFHNEEYTLETLSLTTRILEMNPDYYTIWNIRRSVLLRGILVSEPKKPEDTEHNSTTYKKELDLFMQLIRINPKSYWMWNHRRWCLETMPMPNWAAELGLVEKLLAMDARNFHGWSYRRYVVRQMRQGATEENAEKIVQSEYNFTTKKINESFSNFSAWYQRSRLLPEIVQKLPESERNAIAKDELYMVKEAIYTEPDDQSAWLYYRWILGHVFDPIVFIGGFRFSSSDLVVLIFDDNVSFTSAPRMIDSNTGNTIEGLWLPLNKNNLRDASCAWVYKPSDKSKKPDNICIEAENLISSSLSKSGSFTILNKSIIAIEGDNDDCAHYLSQLQERFKTEKSAVPTQRRLSISKTSEQRSWHTLNHVNLLKEEISTVRELLDIEPDSKWALQTLAYFVDQLRLLNGYDNPEDALVETIDIYEKLAKLDSYRCRRYQDAKHRVERVQDYQSIVDAKGNVATDSVYGLFYDLGLFE